MIPTNIAEVLSGARRWCVLHADNRDVLPLIPDRSIDAIICDPPYSEHIHKSVRSSKRDEILKDDYSSGRDQGQPCRTRRVVDLGFDHLDAKTRRFCAQEFASLVKRWVGVFSDVESCHLWRLSLVAAGLDYIKTAQWRRIGGAPQFTGDRPASGFETITLAHPKGRKTWNGGGKAGSYEIDWPAEGPVYPVPIVQNRAGHRQDRIHTTQKPLALMLALVDDFTNEGEIILDPFCGSATTGEAALARGRRFIGIEREEANAATARERLAAAERGSTIQASRAGQGALFGG